MSDPVQSVSGALGELAGRLRDDTRHLGLSLGDRFAVALARERSLPLVTADRHWERLEVGVRVILIR